MSNSHVFASKQFDITISIVKIFQIVKRCQIVKGCQIVKAQSDLKEYVLLLPEVRKILTKEDIDEVTRDNLMEDKA